jgi:hypothetical protein
MTATRTIPNLLQEIQHLDDNALRYGALILARAIGHDLAAIYATTHCDECTRASHMKIVTAFYGQIINQANPGSALHARRIVITQDAADLAFAP